MAAMRHMDSQHAASEETFERIPLAPMSVGADGGVVIAGESETTACLFIRPWGGRGVRAGRPNFGGLVLGSIDANFCN